MKDHGPLPSDVLKIVTIGTESFTIYRGLLATTDQAFVFETKAKAALPELPDGANARVALAYYLQSLWYQEKGKPEPPEVTKRRERVFRGETL